MGHYMRDRLGLGEDVAHYTFDSFQSRPQLKREEQESLSKALCAAQSFLEAPQTLVFHGPNGIGKSHLAYAIGNALIEKYGAASVPVLFTTFDAALKRIRRDYEKRDERMGEQWFIDKWAGIPVLIVDEIGQRGLAKPASDGDFTRRIGYAIVDSRYRAGHRPMVITTNRTPGELGEWITESAVDRLFEMGKLVQMRGESWRVKSRQRDSKNI